MIVKTHAPTGPKLTALAGLVLGFVFLAAGPAHARKECRPLASEPKEAAEGGNEDGWPHDVQYGWHHDSAATGWVHDRADAGDSAAVEDIDPNWVHETDYGWWAALPHDANEALHEQADGSEPDGGGPEEDCTVSRERNECVVLGNQIARYTFQLALAKERGNERWQGSLEETIERLEARGERFSCPWVEPSFQEKLRVTLAALADAAVVAAQVAAKLYRMGLF